MGATINKIIFPELFIGFVAPIGSDIGPTMAEFRRFFEQHAYSVIEIKVTDVFNVLQEYVKPESPLKKSPLYDRYESHIAYGDYLREQFSDDAILAALTVMRIMRRRLRLPKRDGVEQFSQAVYLLHQFKRKEEVDLLRAIYGDLFFQVSTYSRRGTRVDSLSRRFASDDNVAGPQRFRDKAETLVLADEHEAGKAHGQRVAKIFHDADFIVNTDVEQSVRHQVERFCELLFGSNSISPTHAEYGMFLAKAAALRTLDLSRQVGAAVFSSTGEIIALGSNEVPKATGGTYWEDGPHDDREYVRGRDSNDQRKREILSEIAKILAPDKTLVDILGDPQIAESQFMDALEYGRIVHAEMSAISDAARNGYALRGATLYCTTFPCHMCAKHIVAAGIERVVFLEPYPKSLAADLHPDALQVEGSDRGRFQEFPSVQFQHFFGVSPRRYRELFERAKRKHDDGTFKPYVENPPAPICDVKVPFYTTHERFVAESLLKIHSSLADKASLDKAAEA